MVDNGLQGIFYWDMGNDIDVSNAYCIARNSSYALNANVDSLVTSVNINHPTAIENVSAQGESIVYDAQTGTVTASDATVSAISVYNTAGQLLGSARARNLNAGRLPKGAYIVKAERHGLPAITKYIYVKE